MGDFFISIYEYLHMHMCVMLMFVMILLISPRLSPAQFSLTVQNPGLKHQSFMILLVGSFKHVFNWWLRWCSRSMYLHRRLFSKYCCWCVTISVNECSSDPCINGGTCTDGVNQFTCSCIDGYIGTKCETGE